MREVPAGPAGVGEKAEWPSARGGRMNRVTLLVAGSLALLTLVASTAGACGWEMTCNTQEWAREQLDGILP